MQGYGVRALLRAVMRFARQRGILALVSRIAVRVPEIVREASVDARRRRLLRADLRRHRALEPLNLSRYGEPDVSIVILSCGDAVLLSACLRAVQRSAGDISYEVLAVDGGDDSHVTAFLSECEGVTVIDAARAGGFAAAANEASRRSRGRYLHFLTGDTIVQPHWLAPLLTLVRTDGVVGVGSRLLHPDGTLLEAGSIVWNDGSATNYAPSDSDAGALYVRDVDYCSAASLIVCKAEFDAAGGFDTRFAPSWYGDVDLCFALRSLGGRILYQPLSAAVHGGRVPPNGTVRVEYIEARDTFVRKWGVQLAHCEPADSSLAERASRRRQGRRTLLVMDSFVPVAERDAGSRRLVAIVSLARELGWRVIVVPHESGLQGVASRSLRQLGVEVRPHAGDAFDALVALPVPVDVAWISRYELCDRYIPFLRSRLKIPIIYDTVDLHHLRLRREHEVTGIDTNWQQVREIELRLSHEANITVVTSSSDALLLGSLGISSDVVPIIERTTIHREPIDRRRGVLFVGNYTHAPNVDAARWLCTEIMPLVWERMPNLEVTLVGFDPPSSIRRLSSRRVKIPGYVADLSPFYNCARVFAAPLRFGAGMKGKIVQSLAHGLPVVTTSIGAEGVGLEDGINAFISDDARGCAEAVVALATDDARWTSFADRALGLAADFSPENVKPAISRILDRAMTSARS